MNKTSPLSIMFRAHFKIDLVSPPTLDDDLAKLFEFRQHLRQLSPNLAEWFLGGDTKEQAYLYAAFDESGPTTAIAAVLREKYRNKQSSIISRPIGLWNGETGAMGATMGQLYREIKNPSLVDFDTRVADFLEYPKVLSTTLKMVDIWNPLFVSVEPTFYEPVFKDRPGVGWMLYLPQVLTLQQVPEARALVPVMGKDAKGRARQVGTVIVSVTDAPFSDLNPEHVRIANAIEIRLVDQDMLPRFVDL